MSPHELKKSARGGKCWHLILSGELLVKIIDPNQPADVELLAQSPQCVPELLAM
jgi:hypothetical protein